MNETFVIEFGIILIIASALGVLAKIFRQPLILAYLIAGILIGPFAFGILKNPQIIETFATIGIIFLLFLIGLELNPRKLLEVGSSAVIIGLGQIALSGIIYWMVSTAFGFTGTGAIYLSLGFAFCSTAIIITLLSNKRELDTLHGKIIVGILLVQDFAAIIALTLIPSAKIDAGQISTIFIIGKILVKAIMLFSFAGLASKYVLPPIFSKIAKSHELLFISSLAWCFILVIVASSLDLSPEIGAFLAGITIAPLPYAIHIGAKTSPLRDFFLMIFFIYLGTNLVFENISKMILPAIVFSVLILIINPLIVMLIMGSLGYRKRTSFLTGISLAQISEFTFIILAMGVKIKILSAESITLASMVAIITIFCSTYFISKSRDIFNILKNYLNFLESNKKRKTLSNITGELKNHVVLIGCNRVGSGILETLKENKLPTVVVDFDPKRIQKMIDAGDNCIYGDATDQDIVKDLNIEKAQLVISTLENIEESRLVLSIYKKINKKIKIILIAADDDESIELYGLGADLIIVPTTISSDFISYALERIVIKGVEIDEFKQKSIRSIEKHKAISLEQKFVKSISS